MESGKERQLYGIEIQRIPKSYFKSASNPRVLHPQVTVQNQIQVKFTRFLGAPMHIGVHFAFRIQVRDGNARLLYLVRDSECDSEHIQDALQSQFPEFESQNISEIVSLNLQGPIAVALLSGTPLQARASLNAMAHIMTCFRGQSLYQVIATPKAPSRVGRFLAGRRYKSAVERTQRQNTRQSWLGGQESTTEVDVAAMLASKQLEPLYQRMTAERILECQVTLAFWDHADAETNLRSATSALMAAISPNRRNSRLKVRYLSGSTARGVLRRVLLLEKKRIATELLPSEAVPYFEIPSVDLSIGTASPASYESSGTIRLGSQKELGFEKGKIALGRLYRHGTLEFGRVKRLDLEHLRRHVAILGKTGYGKSSTKNRIAIAAWRNGIPSLLIEPVKADARELMGAIPELRVFTLGDETVTPFRLNPFLVDEGVKVSLHINLLYSCFAAAWPLYGILANHMRQVITNTYLNNGWDPVNNVRGRPITLEMFGREAVRYCDESLTYGSELSQDFRGALLARVRDLCDPARAVIFNTTENLPMEHLLSCPTILELKEIGDPDLKAFLISILLVRVYEYFNKRGRSDRLRCLLVIDEAHRVLEEIPKTADTNEVAQAKRQAIDQLVNLISEARSSGLGVVLGEQIPTRLALNALKNCDTHIVHKLTSPDDLRLMAQETGCNREQSEHIKELQVGEAVVREPSSNAPYDVQILHDPDVHPDMKRALADDDVRKGMHQFYKDHPAFAKTPEIPVIATSARPDQEPVTDSVVLAIQVDDMVQTDAFRDLYMKAMEVAKEDIESLAIEAVIAHYAVHLQDTLGDPVEIAFALCELASTSYGPSPCTPDYREITRLIDERNSPLIDSDRRNDTAV